MWNNALPHKLGIHNTHPEHRGYHSERPIVCLLWFLKGHCALSLSVVQVDTATCPLIHLKHSWSQNRALNAVAVSISPGIFCTHTYTDMSNVTLTNTTEWLFHYVSRGKRLLESSWS
jgi:hypothetical protein